MTEKRNGQQVDPAALAAFYRHRSESLRNSHTVAREGTQGMNQAQLRGEQTKRPTVGIVEYVISALQGHPGYMNK